MKTGGNRAQPASTAVAAKGQPNLLTEFQHEVDAVGWLQRTIALTKLVPSLESLGADLPSDEGSASETRLLLWADQFATEDSPPKELLMRFIHEAFDVIANALAEFRNELSERFKASRKKLTVEQTEHLGNLIHAENQFRELHAKYPSFRPTVYLHPARLQIVYLLQRGQLTDVIEKNPPNDPRSFFRRRLFRLDKNGHGVPVVWEEFGFDLDDSDFIEDTLAGPRPGPDDIGRQLLGKLKRAVLRLNELRSKEPDAMRQPAWPEQSLELAWLKLSDIVAELDVDGKARENLKRGPRQRSEIKKKRDAKIREELAEIRNQWPNQTLTSARSSLARRPTFKDGTPMVGLRTIVEATKSSKGKH